MYTTRVGGELTKDHHISLPKISNFTTNLTKVQRIYFTKKYSEFDLNSKQICWILVKRGTVEEEVADMQEMRSSNPCMYGNCSKR